MGNQINRRFKDLPPVNPVQEEEYPMPGNSAQINTASHKRTSWLGMMFRVGIASVVGLGFVGIIFAYIWADNLRLLTPPTQKIEVIANWLPEDNTIVYDREGEKIGEFFNKYHIFTPYQELPEAMIESVLAIEDRTFWKHPGFDLRGIFRSGVNYLVSIGKKKQGGSTITQQVVRNFLLSKEKTLHRKALEIFYSYNLEKEVSKERILEIYCNAMFMGFGSYGLGAAAHRYFGKDLKDLEVHQFALLAGLFQSPSRYNPHRHPKRAKKRQLQVLGALVSTKYLTLEAARQWARKPLGFKNYVPTHGKTSSSYFVDHIRIRAKEIIKDSSIRSAGLRIYTTLDSKLQRFADQAVENAAPLLDETAEKAMAVKDRKTGLTQQPRIQTALLSIDPRNGEVLAMVGGRDYKESQFNRVTHAMRSPGSAFKPIVYSLALMNQYKWNDVLYVSPVTLNGDYRPKNPSKDYLTETTVIRSFYRSMNAPTMEIGKELGLRKVIQHAENMGIRTPIKKEFGSLLGQSETTMIDMARMMSVFPNNGSMIEPISILKVTDRNGKILYEAPHIKDRSHQSLPKSVNYLMVDGMRNVFKRGTAYQHRQFGSYAAGKTGTSNDSKDNWFVGFTSDLVTLVWAGTDEYTPIYGNTMGSTIALPTWADYMTQATKERPNKAFIVPKNVVKIKAHHQYGYRTHEGMPMWFVKGKEPDFRTSALETISKNGGKFRTHIVD